MDRFQNACHVLKHNSINEPTFIFRKHILLKAVDCFKNLKCNILYAVKTNPDKFIIEHLIDAGVHSFDVASIGEIEKVTQISKEKNVKISMYFMHPVKPRYAIREAYHKYGVRHFSLDSQHELDKILHETDNAKDLCLHLRVAVPNSFAEINLWEKFGVNLNNAADLLKNIKKVAYKSGVCFHVGSQCMHSDAYTLAIDMLAKIVNEISVDYFNIGGGFPSVYPGLKPAKMEVFFNAIHKGFEKLKDKDKITFLAEPGRAIVAECMSLLVRIDLRKESYLYINDGTYGSLFDAGFPKFTFPVRLLTEKQDSDLVAFQFYGPTCDSLDYMDGPFYLPSNAQEGDYIEIGQMGSYSKSISTGFNGFTINSKIFEVEDEPIITLY